jgi:biotin operon repressor
MLKKVRQLRSQLIEILNVPHRGYASGFDSPAALLDGLFEHPANLFLS